ncbi:alpha-L-rhamnosidase [Pedobacter sp. UYEF25]
MSNQVRFILTAPSFFLENKISFRQVIIVSILAMMLYATAGKAQMNYKPVSGTVTGKPIAFSPDPLSNVKWAAPKATDNLQYYVLKPISFTTKAPRSFDMTRFKSKNEIVVNGTGDIRFDFGKVSAGWLEFDSEDLADSVQMSISEYNEPAVLNIGTEHHFKTANVTKNGNTYRLKLNKLWYEGVRFGWIHIRTHKKQWHIKNVRLICQIKPTNYLGSFDCSDKELTKIWYTGAYTVKLNLLKDYFGAILMDRSDRHSWTGDAFPAQAASMVAFGNYDFVKKNLHNTADLSNDIASYALYWVLSLIDYVNYTGDTALATQYIANASKKLDLAYDQFGKSPKINFYGWDERLGGGFENPNQEAQNAYSMLSIRAWSEFGNLMQTMGNTTEAEKYKSYAHEKMQTIRSHDTWLATFGLHAAADAINTSLTTGSENKMLFDNNFTDRVNRLSYSSFNEWFIISAMAKAQHFDEAIGAIHDSWGGQIRYGGTTFFEVYRPQWNNILGENDAPVNNQAGYTSFTHPWSAGVVKWLSEEILGIKPITPGFKTFAIVPHLGRTLTSVSGDIPTLKGNISASFDAKTGISKITIPVGTKAEKIALPLGKNIPASLTINGKLQWTANNKSNAQISIESAENEDFLVMHNLKPGQYLFEVKYKSRVQRSPIKELPWIYKIKSIDQDSLTGGKWTGKYGTDGFVLFNALEKGKANTKMPAYLDTVMLNRYQNVHAAIAQSDVRILQNGTIANSFGAVQTIDYNICEQSMTIDIPVKDNKPHRVSLYFLDQDNLGRRSAIEIFDLKTLNLIAPMAYIKTYKQGKYVSFDFTGPIRLRVNQVRGINVSLSGLFFDKAKLNDQEK